jgi:hypothetical protein
MNGRLLSPHVKDANRRGRNQRNARRQARRRRERLLAELAAIDGTGMAAQLLTPQESLDLLTAHLARAKAVMPRVRRTLRLARMGQSDGAPTTIHPAPPRPVRVLREQNRGNWPVLLASAIDVDQPLTLVEAMAATTRHAEDGASPHVLLDFFVRASGLPWATAAQVLEQRRLIPGAFSPWDIRAIREARGFRDRYRNGRASYSAAVSAGDVVAMHGDFALFESEQLADLLPGLHMPRLLRRTAYLANLVRDHEGLTLDIHAFPSALPLVRHPIDGHG